MIEEFQRSCLNSSEYSSGSTCSSLADIISYGGDCVVVLSDVSFDSCSSLSKAGIVILNKADHILEIITCQLYNCSFPLEAELGAILEGVKATVGHKREKLIMVADCVGGCDSDQGKGKIVEFGWVHLGLYSCC